MFMSKKTIITTLSTAVILVGCGSEGAFDSSPTTPPTTPPTFSALQVGYDAGNIVITTACENCEASKTAYEYYLDGISTGPATLSNQYHLLPGDKGKSLGVKVTIENEFCDDTNNIGCKTTTAEVVNSMIYAKSIIPNYGMFQYDIMDMDPTKFNSESAFAALLSDGSVVTWGDAYSGGDSSHVQTQLVNIKSISNSNFDFVAINDFNEIAASWGGWIAPQTPSLSNVVSVEMNNGGGAAALLSDGTVETWGVASQGGDSSNVQPLTGVASFPEYRSFNTSMAALKANGTVVTWTSPGSTSNPYEPPVGLVDVQKVFATGAAYAGLKSDGTVVSWGYSYSGGDSSSVTSQLVNVVDIFSNNRAFAALKSDGTVVTWGDANRGGDSSAVQSQLSDVTSIASVVSDNEGAFLAVKTDGSVVAWGNTQDSLGNPYCGDISSVQSQLTDITEIATTHSSCAALKSDGTVVVWGDPNTGGDASSVQNLLVGVEDISATKTAFAAVRHDGVVVTWGTSEAANSDNVKSQLFTLNETYRDMGQ